MNSFLPSTFCSLKNLKASIFLALPLVLETVHIEVGDDLRLRYKYVVIGGMLSKSNAYSSKPKKRGSKMREAS